MSRRTLTGLLAIAVLAVGCGRLVPSELIASNPRQLGYEDLRHEFDSIDRNRDGYINAREYGLWPDTDASADTWRQQEYDAQIDLNGDGRTTWNEFHDARRRTGA